MGHSSCCTLILVILSYRSFNILIQMVCMVKASSKVTAREFVYTREENSIHFGNNFCPGVLLKLFGVVEDNGTTFSAYTSFQTTHLLCPGSWPWHFQLYHWPQPKKHKFPINDHLRLHPTNIYTKTRPTSRVMVFPVRVFTKICILKQIQMPS